MRIDPSIALSVRTPQMRVPSAFETYGQAMQLKQLALANQARDFDLRQAEEEMAQERALRDLYAQTPNPTEADVLRTAGARGIPIVKNMRDAAAADLVRRQGEIDLAGKQIARLGQLLDLVGDQASWEAAIETALREKLIDPQFLSRLPGRYDATAVAGFRKSLLDFKTQFELRAKEAAEARAAAEHGWKKEEHETTLPGKAAEARQKEIVAGQYSDLGMPAAERERIDQAERDRQTRIAEAEKNRAVQIRGQNMTDSRARELNEIARDQKPPTEPEKKNLGFYMRAAEATRNLDELEGEMAQTGRLGQFAYRNLPEWALSERDKRYRQAERAFTEARLRKDSGAAVPPHEYEQDALTYFPQTGDTPQVLAQKKAARRQVLRSLRISAGRAMREIGEEPGDLRPGAQPEQADPLGIR